MMKFELKFLTQTMCLTMVKVYDFQTHTFLP